jgi:hypothetical protein
MDVIQDLSTAHQLGSSLNRPVNFKLGPKFCKPLHKMRPLIVAVRQLDLTSPTKYLGHKSRSTSQRTELFSGTKTNVGQGNVVFFVSISRNT